MGARSTQGCLICRRRKKKCDEVKPVCKACLRNNFDCVWPAHVKQESPFGAGIPPRQQTFHCSKDATSSINKWALTSASSQSRRPTATIPPTLSRFALPGSVPLRSETWRLLDHYLKDTANRLVCLQDSQNPLLHTILPAALNDELLMNSILALSGVHMMQRLPQLEFELRSLTWSSYTRALAQLRVALPDAFREPPGAGAAWRALLVVLLFYLLEATRGSDPNAMQKHLEGAHHLMTYVTGSTSKSAEPSTVSLATELYVYNAALASFTTYCPPIPSLPYDLLGGQGISTKELGVMCGCAYELFTFIPKVSTLLWDATSLSSLSGPNVKALVLEYYNLRASIENWHPESDQREMILCAELYQRSLLLLLDSRFLQDTGPGLVDEGFQNLESLLSRLSPQSPVATTATWPVFVFGIHARTEHQKDLVRSYLRSLIKTFGMGVMTTAINQLEKVWMLDPSEDLVGRLFANQNALLLIC